MESTQTADYFLMYRAELDKNYKYTKPASFLLDIHATPMEMKALRTHLLIALAGTPRTMLTEKTTHYFGATLDSPSEECIPGTNGPGQS